LIGVERETLQNEAKVCLLSLSSLGLRQNQLFCDSFCDNFVSFSGGVGSDELIEGEDAAWRVVYFLRKESDEVLAE
jgi:hypothetical protein